MKLFHNKGQGVIEYMLIFAVVVVVFMLALSENGFFTQAINKSLDMSINGFEKMVNQF